MGTSINDKEWAAMQDGEIIEREDSKLELYESLWHQGLGPSDCEITALPKPHCTLTVTL